MHFTTENLYSSSAGAYKCLGRVQFFMHWGLMQEPIGQLAILNRSGLNYQPPPSGGSNYQPLLSGGLNYQTLLGGGVNHWTLLFKKEQNKCGQQQKVQNAKIGFFFKTNLIITEY